MSINPKTKGASAERELAHLLETALGADFTRNLEQCRGGGVDLLCENIPWLALEVKRRETLAIGEWWRQAQRQAKADQIPALAYRQNRRPWLFVIPLSAVLSGAPETALATLDTEGFLWWVRSKNDARVSVGAGSDGGLGIEPALET